METPFPNVWPWPCLRLALAFLAQMWRFALQPGLVAYSAAVSICTRASSWVTTMGIHGLGLNCLKNGDVWGCIPLKNGLKWEMRPKIAGQIIENIDGAAFPGPNVGTFPHNLDFNVHRFPGLWGCWCRFGTYPFEVGGRKAWHWSRELIWGCETQLKKSLGWW